MATFPAAPRAEAYGAMRGRIVACRKIVRRGGLPYRPPVAAGSASLLIVPTKTRRILRKDTAHLAVNARLVVDVHGRVLRELEPEIAIVVICASASPDEAIGSLRAVREQLRRRREADTRARPGADHPHTSASARLFIARRRSSSCRAVPQHEVAPRVIRGLVPNTNSIRKRLKTSRLRSQPLRCCHVDCQERDDSARFHMLLDHVAEVLAGTTSPRP